MAKESRDNMLLRLSALQNMQDDLPQIAVENIIASNGEDCGKNKRDEVLFRLALEVKIYRLKEMLSHTRGYVGDRDNVIDFSHDLTVSEDLAREFAIEKGRRISLILEEGITPRRGI